MLILDRDGAVLQTEQQPPGQPPPRWGYAELVAQPEDNLASSIDWLFALAFEQLQLSGLEILIRETEPL